MKSFSEGQVRIDTRSRRGLVTTFVVAALVLFGLTSTALVISAVMLLQQGESTRRTLQMDYLERGAEELLRQNLGRVFSTESQQQDGVLSQPLQVLELMTGREQERARITYRLIREEHLTPQEKAESQLCEIQVELMIREQKIVSRRSYLWLSPSH
ncbi:hypothetical protein [Planctopirus hydrillae]|uniref:hypothetical protein n=1 Tax=Planctopirus hydrillae TaxID=1841610 RepID=UPI00083B7A14|nr:hypothetical protein [Planctopirus hydrillae]